MSVKSKQSVEMEPGEYVIATVVKYTEVGQILSGGSEGPAEAALGLIGRDMDEATGDMPRGEVINCYEFKLADVKFTVDVVAKLPASRHTGDSWDDPVAE
jgi:hypothetical protein